MKTVMQKFIDNAKTAKEHSKDGYVTYDEVIEVATELLEEEKTQMENCYNEGHGNGRMSEAGLEGMRTFGEYFHYKYLLDKKNNDLISDEQCNQSEK